MVRIQNWGIFADLTIESNSNRPPKINYAKLSNQ